MWATLFRFKFGTKRSRERERLREVEKEILREEERERLRESDRLREREIRDIGCLLDGTFHPSALPDITQNYQEKDITQKHHLVYYQAKSEVTYRDTAYLKTTLFSFW